MLLTKEIEVRPRGAMIQYYKDKGYDARYNQPLIVKIEDLPKNSHIHVNVECDICKVTNNIRYKDYNKIVYNSNYYCCEKCAQIKRTETMQKKYGCNNAMQNKDIYLKQSNSLKDNYGVTTPLKNANIFQKLEKTMVNKYGVRCSAFSPEIREKISTTLYLNASQKTSYQQRYICNLYHGVLNYPIKYYSADIYLQECNIICEYDGGGHNLNVKKCQVTQEEFDQKEIIRNNVIKREGYKQMRIISTKDLLPSDQILLQMLEQTRKYFSDYPNHSWIEFNIDTSTVRNAENKDGVFYDYGELRRIKKSDVENSDENMDCA